MSNEYTSYLSPANAEENVIWIINEIITVVHPSGVYIFNCYKYNQTQGRWKANNFKHSSGLDNVQESFLSSLYFIWELDHIYYCKFIMIEAKLGEWVVITNLDGEGELSSAGPLRSGAANLKL